MLLAGTGKYRYQREDGFDLCGAYNNAAQEGNLRRVVVKRPSGVVNVTEIPFPPTHTIVQIEANGVIQMPTNDRKEPCESHVSSYQGVWSFTWRPQSMHMEER